MSMAVNEAGTRLSQVPWGRKWGFGCWRGALWYILLALNIAHCREHPLAGPVVQGLQLRIREKRLFHTKKVRVYI